MPQYEGPLQLLETQSRTAGGAPWVGEIGAGRGRADEAWLRREMGVLDPFRLGWAYRDRNECGRWAFVQEPEVWPEVARAYPEATPGRLTELAYDPAAGTLDVGFDGRTAGRSLDVAIPSRWSNWQVSSSQPNSGLRVDFDAVTRLLHVFLRDTLDHHQVTIKFVA